VQEDETELENGRLRRLYRILNLPVPDMSTSDELLKNANSKPKRTNLFE